MTLNRYLHDWLSIHCVDLKPRTRDSYADLIDRLICPAIGSIDVDQLTADEVRHLLASIIDQGHSRTAEMVYVLLRCALAESDNQVMAKVKRPKHRQKHCVPWTDEQAMIYIRACAEHPHGLAFLLALCCGLRRGEICGLRWRCVDFERNELHIIAQRVRLADGQIVDIEPKSQASTRDIPIPAPLLPALRRARGLPDGLVCSLTPSSLSHAHTALVARLGLPPIGLHGLRHTFATSTVKHGGDIRALQDILGHSSYAVTLQIYTHPDHEMKATTIDASTTAWYNGLTPIQPKSHLTLNQGVQGSSP